MHGIHFQLFYEESEKNFTVFLPYATDASHHAENCQKWNGQMRFFVLK